MTEGILLVAMTGALWALLGAPMNLRGWSGFAALLRTPPY